MGLLDSKQLNQPLNLSGSFTGSFQGTASYALTASYAANANIETGSFVLTSSYNADSASFDTRINSITFDTSSLLLTSSFNSFTASYNTHSASFDSRINNISFDTGSLISTGSVGGTRLNRPATGSYIGQYYFQNDELIGNYYWDGVKWQYQQDDNQVVYARTTATTMGGGLTTAQSGTGAGTTTATFINSTAVALNTGTTTTGRAHWYMNRTYTARANETWVYSFRGVVFPILDTDLAEDFYSRIGCGVSNNAKAYFEFGAPAASIDPGNIGCATIGAAGESSDSGVLEEIDKEYHLVIVIRIGVDVRFYIDGVLVSTHTTQIPQIGTSLSSIGMHIQKQDGTTNRQVGCYEIIIKQYTYQH